jgi:hypothetical protein
MTTRAERIARRKRRRWLRFWSKHFKPLPASHTLRTIERLEGDDYRMRYTGEVGILDFGVTFIESGRINT